MMARTRGRHSTQPQESEMAMLPLKQSATTLPPTTLHSATLATAVPISTGHQWPSSQTARHPVHGADAVPVWDLVSSVERAAAAARLVQLEREIDIARWELHNAKAELNRIHQTLQSGAGTSWHASEQILTSGGNTGLPCEAGTASATRHHACASVASLTSRQREVLDLVLAGHPSKNIAADLGISQRTVDNHRAAIMRKTGSKSLPALVRTAMAAA
jgi:DNA-binding CsgD family transcriptional regulator